MNDHNLDDLIINTPHNKGGKAKGLLIIIALLIVVLIVAIILTKITLKDPSQDHAILADNETEMISPELTLQESDVEDREDQKALSEMIDSEIKGKTEHQISQKEANPLPQEAVTTEKTPAPAKTETIEKKSTPKATPPTQPKSSQVKEIVKIPSSTAKPVRNTMPKPAPKQASHEQFYIQVGSFSQNPSIRLINAVKKQGYAYKVMRISGMNKVLIGPYPSRAAVDKAIVQVRDLINKNAFVVKK